MQLNMVAKWLVTGKIGNNLIARVLPLMTYPTVKRDNQRSSLFRALRDCRRLLNLEKKTEEAF